MSVSMSFTSSLPCPIRLPINDTQYFSVSSSFFCYICAQWSKKKKKESENDDENEFRWHTQELCCERGDTHKAPCEYQTI